MIDVAEAIDAESWDLVWTTQSHTKNAEGERVDGSPTDTPIRGTIQPAKGAQLMDLPEGIREEARFLLWTRSSVQLNDVVKDGARAYRVMFLWHRREGEFTRAAVGLTR